MVEVDRNYASKGQANLNTVLGSLGTAGFVGNMLPILGGILGGTRKIGIKPFGTAFLVY